MQNPTEDPNKPPEIKTKKINGVEFSEFDLGGIRIICDYLFLDRFNDSASFVRFEQCFGPLFSTKNKQFKLYEAYQEIIGPKRKYLTFKRMIKAYLKWKSKSSNNYSFNYFMTEVFQNILKKKGEVVGELVEGQRVFSTKNCKNRKIITKFSVLTDEKKNIIKGFVLEYDGVFKAPLCKQEKKEDIHLEINFNLFNAQGDKLSREMQLDRDGISHIAGKYNETTKNIKFLIFKCRSGKTLYIGDPTEAETDKIVPFIFGSSKYQLKMMHIELINDQLAYIQPRYQLSTRKNDNIDINFDDFNEKFLENDPPKFEESDLEKLSDEELKDYKKNLMPMVPDDQFVDKLSLVEDNYGKSFKEVYKSIFDDGKKAINKLKDSIRKLIDDSLSKEKRQQKLENEHKNIVLRDSYIKKNNFDSLFVKVIKMKKKLQESMNQNVNEENDDFAVEEEEDEDELNLQKIDSGVYVVKEKSVPLRAQAKKEETSSDKKKEKEPQDNVAKSKAKENDNKKEEKGPKDSVKK